MNRDFPDFADNATTHIVAVGGVTSPMWLHHLSDLSQTVLPTLGVIWLLYQGAILTYDTFFRKKPK